MTNQKTTVVALGILFGLTPLAWAYRVGDFQLAPSVATGLQYDDNITQAHTNTKSDAVATLTGALDVTLESKLRTLGIKAAVTRSQYTQETSQSTTSETFGVNYAQDFDPNRRMNASDSFYHANTPASFADEFGRIAGSYNYYLNRFNVNYIHELSKQWSMTAGYANELYDPSRQDLSSSMQNAATLRSDYALTGTTSVFGVYGLSRRSFNPGGHVTTNTFDVGIREFFSSKTYMDLVTGLSSTLNSLGQRSHSPRYEAALTHEISGKTKAVVSLTRHTDSTYTDSSLFKAWRASVSLVHRLTNRLSGTAELFHGQGKYTQSNNVKDTFDGLSGRATYDLTPNTGVYLAYSYSKTNSTDDTQDYTRNIVSAGVEIKF